MNIFRISNIPLFNTFFQPDQSSPFPKFRKSMHSELLSHFQSEHKSVEERMEIGKALRKKISRSEQGKYIPSPDRADPISILEAQGKTRLPDLVPIRYARMLTSPFAFLRGGAAIMAADLSAQGETYWNRSADLWRHAHR